MKKTVGLLLTAAILSGIAVPVLAQNNSLRLYSGKGEVSVTADPTGSDIGNVFFINGFETNRGSDKEKGVNPYIEIPETYLYEERNGKYTMKKEWSVSFDWYECLRDFDMLFTQARMIYSVKA